MNDLLIELNSESKMPSIRTKPKEIPKSYHSSSKHQSVNNQKQKEGKMSYAKKAKMSSLINEVLPKELLVSIFKKLGLNGIKSIRLSCQKWRRIVEDFNLVKAATGMRRFNIL